MLFSDLEDDCNAKNAKSVDKNILPRRWLETSV